MPKKTPGKLNAPPPQGTFDTLPLQRWCRPVQGVFYRLHSVDHATGTMWHPVHFSRRGATRFDPKEGTGTLCLGNSLSTALLETFDDLWGPVGDLTRTLSPTDLAEWWVTLLAIPPVPVLLAQADNLSKMGTDLQLLSGEHSTAREWARRIMAHPARVGGIRYLSRHHTRLENLALFLRDGLLPAESREDLIISSPSSGKPNVRAVDKLLYGPSVMLRDHPELPASLRELEVGLLP